MTLHARERPHGPWEGCGVCPSSGPSSSGLCWRDRGGGKGWLLAALCWASQTLTAVIVELVHSAFLMGKHRW